MFAPGVGSVPAGKAGILVLGDSLSSAFGIPPEAGWVALLAERLDQRPIAVVNASIAGETTSGALARLPRLLAEQRPELVVLELGANDALRGQPVSFIRDKLAALVTACREAGAQVLLIGTEIPVNYGPQYRDTLRSMYQGLAREFKLPLVPFLLEGIALDLELMQEDGLHPVAAAQPAILDNVWPVLAPLLPSLEQERRAEPKRD